MSASYAQLALPESSPGTENDRNVNAHIANVLRLKLLHQIAAGDAAASSLPPYGHDLLAFIPRARVPHLDSQLLSDHVLRLLQSAKLPPVPQAAVLMLGLHVLVEVVGNRWVHSSLLGSLAGVGELADYHGGGSRAGGGDEDDPFRGWALEEIHEYLSDALLTSDAERSDPALSAKLYEAIARLDSVRLWKVLTHALKKAAAQRPAAAAATAGASTTPSSPSPPPSAAAASTSTATNAAWKQFQKYATLALLAADFDAVLAAEEREPALRDYQREAVEAIWNGGNNSTNYIIVSPTGTGKTRIFVETSRLILERNPSAKILVVVPSVPLSEQHKRGFVEAGFEDRQWYVQAYSSDRSLNERNWSRELATKSVLISTSQCVVNCLEAGAASFDQLDLLVLDETHRASGEHPHAVIMRYYCADPERSKRCQAIGVTASPGAKVTVEETEEVVRELQASFGPTARLFAIGEEAVRQVVPSAEERETYVSARSVDRAVGLSLAGFVYKGVAALSKAMEEFKARGGAELAVSKRAARALLEAPPTLSRSLAPLYLNAVPSTLVEQYTQGCASFAEEYGLTHLLFFSRLLNVAHEAMAEHCLKEAGFEAALQLLAAELYQIALDWEKPELVSQARAVQARAAMVAGTVTATAGGGGGGGSGSGNAARLSAVQDDLDDLLARKKIVDVAVEIFEGRGTFDFPAAVGRLLSETLAGDVHLLRRAYPSGRTQEHNTFPKFWALLQGFASRDSFKGIVFVKTRRGVAHLANMVRRCDQLAFLDVYEFAGHGGSNKGAAAKKKRDDGVEESKVERGLTGKQQVAVIEAFRGAGRKLLISTSAAEEGLDIPTCEFVVRYNSANTGIQRVQSRGRSRALGSEFICIVQRDSLDLHLHKKSHLEEVVMKRYLAVKAASSSASASKGGGGAVAAATTGGRAAGSK